MSASEDSVTRWCLQCGGEFVAGLTECPDCGLELVDERPADHLAPDLDAEGETEYDLAEWAAESRLMVQQLLQADRVPHAWQGTTLVVPRAFEARSDLVIDHVDATTLPTLDEDSDLVAYDLDEWDDEQIDELVAILDMEGIAYAFDEDGDLVVAQSDEERVEATIATMNTVAPGGDGEGGDDDSDVESGYDIDAGQLLSDLFVAADRLMHRASDHEGVLALVDNAAYARAAAIPYGFAPAVWADILTLVDAVCDLLEADESADEDIEQAARVLRDALRQYV